MNAVEKLEAAITKSNDMVIGASFAIMDTGSSSREQEQARYFQSLFSAIRNVLQGALGAARDLDEGATPDEPASAAEVLSLADAILGGAS